MNPSQPPLGQNPQSADNPVQASPYQSTPHDPANPYPQQPQQQQPGFPMGPKTDGFAVTSMVLGIISIFTCFFGVIFGGLAVIFGHIAYSKINKDPQNIGGKGLAIAGLTTGYIGLVIAIIFIISAAQEESYSEIFQEAYLEELERTESDDPFSDQE